MSSQNQDFTEANRIFFDDLAAKYDIAPWQQQVSLQITDYLQQALDFIHPILSPPSHRSNPVHKKNATTLLDYACGTGMISRALGPYVTKITAIDLSSKMVERYTELARESEIPTVKDAKVMEGNLLAEAQPSKELSGPELYDFDIAAICAGFHHFADPDKAIERLAQRLRIGGVLLIVDFVEDEKGGWSGAPNGAEHTIHKHGFSEKEMRELMEGQGLGNFGWNVMPEKIEMQFKDRTVYRTVFLARATRKQVAN